MKRTTLALLAATALGSLAFTTPALATGSKTTGTAPAPTSTSINATTAFTDPTLKITALQTKSFYDGQQFGAMNPVATSVYFGDGTGKKAKVTDAGWAALLHASAGFQAMRAQSATSLRDQLKRVAFIDKADQPAPVTFYTAASRGMFAA